MALDFGAYLAKYLLCLFNFIFFIGGSVMLSVGIWLAVDKKSFIQLTKITAENHQIEYLSQPSVIEQGAYILIAAGAFIFIISFLGYCGAIKESRFLLTAYGMFLVIILALEIAAGVLAAMYKKETDRETRQFLKYTLNEYYTIPKEADVVTIAWNHMMAELKCCGSDNFTDFKNTKKWRTKVEDDVIVPEPCCKLDETKLPTEFVPLYEGCTRGPTVDNSNHVKGCYETLVDWINKHANIVIGVGVGIGLLQLVGVVLAFCLCKAIDNDMK